MRWLMLVAVVAVAGCETVNNETVKDMPSGYLCRMLDSREYISLPSEQRAIYAELERRGVECIDGHHKVTVKVN